MSGLKVSLSSTIAEVVMPLAVVGSNCPNGDLQNTGVKPEDAEAESQKGMIPGVVVLHARPETKGANQLLDNLGNLMQVKRSYRMPVVTSGNVIWLQFGTGTKWNSQMN